MKKLKVFVLIFAIAIMGLPRTVSAQNQDDGTGSGGLSISPTRFEFVIERGEDELIKMQVKNVTNVDIVARAFLNDFEPDGTTGNPVLIVDGNREQSSSSLREFLIGLEDVPIKSGETAEVNLPLQIPENAAPGAYYGAIRFQAAPSEQSENSDSQLSLNASVAAIVLVEVPGDITEKIEITSAAGYLNDKKGSLFTKKPNKTGITIKNLGNGFSKPFGAVSVTGPWGRGEVQNYELNDVSPRGNVLPGSSRLFLEDLQGVSMPGRYTITANISHGRGGEVITATASFWYIPTWLVVVLALVVLALIGAAFYLTRKYKTRSVKRRR